MESIFEIDRPNTIERGSNETRETSNDETNNLGA